MHAIRLFFFLFICLPIYGGFNRSLFFRASSFWDEPRFEKPFLGTFDIQLLGGSTHMGRNARGKKTNILGIYGPENIEALSSVEPNHPLILPGNPKTICFQAVADVLEADFNLYQNFCRGVFLHFHFPVILLHIFPSGYLQDEFCTAVPCKHYTPAWEIAVRSLNTFLSDFDLCINRVKKAAPSDSTLFVGWTHSFENTTYLDFIDTTIKTGILFPTGKRKNTHEVFDIPYGYNGHWAIPLSWDISVGALDWLTAGFHIDNLFFLHKIQCVRMKSEHEVPTGVITLGEGLADVKPGIVWRTGGYLKADHFFSGLSFLLAFTYEQQNKSTLIPCNQEVFNVTHVNDTMELKKWARSIAHILVEYDFAHEESHVGPHIGFFYDKEFTGLRVFNLSVLGGYFGIDVNWCF